MDFLQRFGRKACRRRLSLQILEREVQGTSAHARERTCSGTTRFHGRTNFPGPRSRSKVARLCWRLRAQRLEVSFLDHELLAVLLEVEADARDR